ncbi:MAG: AraC family transcriptional regulator [Bacteroidales bacterium]|nr:AraC family transcriptional regulator [Bacteroidales bacterium]
MSCHCCLKLVTRILSDAGVAVVYAKLGEAEIIFDPHNINLPQIAKLLEVDGFEIVNDKEKQLVEQIKSAIIDLIYYSTYNAMVRNSDYLVERFGLSYQYISTIFSKQEQITLEKFIIHHKIERAKELIQYNELTLSEIAYMMGYSSVQYLSTQFRAITGISVSEYKKDPGEYRTSLKSAINPNDDQG